MGYTGADGLSNFISQLGAGRLTDPAGTPKLVFNQTVKAIANGSATSLFTVARANNVAAGGQILYHAVATDGTDYQAIFGVVTYAHVDKAGTGTFTITDDAGNVAKAVSTGTYTLAWTYVTGTAIGTVKLQPTTSLTATVHTVSYTVVPMAGTITIL